MPTDFDDGPPTQLEVADELVEDLAVDGPVDDENEVTPTVSVHDACGICRLVRKYWLLDAAPPPETCQGAWTLASCCGPRDGRWAWCPLKGLLSVDGVVRDCNRRKNSRGGPPPGTPERRRPLQPLRQRG